MAGKGRAPGPRRRGKGPGAGGSLVERYRKILVEKLTPEDLRELKFSLRNQFDENGNLDTAYKARFEGKLREIMES